MLVSLTEAKPYLRSPDADDDLVEALIRRASADIERYTGRHFTPTELTEHHDGNLDVLLFMRRRPVLEVERVVDTAVDPEQELESDRYILYPEEGYLAYPGHWPSGRRRWRVEYTAGYEEVPEDVQQAVIFQVATWYQQVGKDPQLQSESIGDYSYTVAAMAEEAGLSPGVDRMLAPYREVRF